MTSAVLCQTSWNWSEDIIKIQQIFGSSIGIQTDDDMSGEEYNQDEFAKPDLIEDTNVIGPTDAEDQDKSDVELTRTLSPGLYSGIPFGPPLILQHVLESIVRAAQCVEFRGSSHTAVQYTSHYDIMDDEFHDYVLTSDKSASSQSVSGMQLCPFCGEVVTPSAFCCTKYKDSADASQGAAAAKKNETERLQESSKKSKKKANKSSASDDASQTKTQKANDARRLAKERSEQRKRERALALQRASAERGQSAAVNGQNFSAGTKQGQISAVITYQLSSQKCLDDGWTVWPQVAAAKYNNSLQTTVSASRASFTVSPAKLHQESVGDHVVMRCYDNGKTFIIIFQEGSGNVFYPSGRLAITILTVGHGLFTYIVQDDSAAGNIMAIFLPSGHGIVYHLNGQPRVCVTPVGGEEFDVTGARQRRWTWYERAVNDSNITFDLPTLYPVTLGVNYNCSVRIISQHSMSLTFSAECRTCRFHVGSKQEVQVDRRKLQPVTSLSCDEIYLKDIRNKFEGLLQKVSTTLQFPNSPKLDLIPLTPHLQSRQRKIDAIKKTVHNSAVADSDCSC